MFEDETKSEQSQTEQASDQSALFKVGDREYDVESASKKISSADTHIAQLEKELQDLRGSMSKLDKLDKLEELLQAKQTPAHEPETTPTQAAPQAQFNKDELLQELLGELDSRSQETVLKANEQKAVQAAKDKFGTDYQTKLLERGQELQMDKKAIQDFARTKPAAFAALFGLNTQGKESASPSSSVYIKPEPKSDRSVSEVLMSKGSAKDRTDFIADALKNPDKYLKN